METPSSSPFTPDELERLIAMWAGRLSASDADAVAQWLAIDPERQAAASLLHEAWESDSVTDMRSGTDAFVVGMMERVHNDAMLQPAGMEIRTRHVDGRQPPTRHALSPRRPVWPRVVAGVAGLATVVAGIVLMRPVFSTHEGAPVIYTTARGETKVLTLADGSRVTLAPATELIVPSVFGDDNREVTLRGHAYFDVKHTQGAPFIVRTGSVRARVLGTAFAVQRYPDDTATQIAVVTGKISAEGAYSSTILTAGMIGHVTDSVVTTLPSAAMEQQVGWLQGRLVFRNAPASDMLASLGRWYGYAFRLNDSTLASRRVTAMFNASDASETLLALQRLLGVSVSVADTVITLTPDASVRLSPQRAHPLRDRDWDSLTSRTGVGR